MKEFLETIADELKRMLGEGADSVPLDDDSVRILRRMQIVTIWKVPFSIWMVRLRQTILMHSRMEIYRRIRRHSRMEM